MLDVQVFSTCAISFSAKFLSAYRGRERKISQDGQSIIYHSKINPGIKRNFEVFDPCEWLAAITVHVPDKG
ncbi:MAG: hypothetical protein AB1797_06485, partial [bacterium]